MTELGRVDGHDILERVAAIPVSTWSYLWDEGSVSHIGPMAQDFYAAFGLGVDDRHINPADGQGVALAAIQALYELVRRQGDEIAELRARVDRFAAEGA